MLVGFFNDVAMKGGGGLNTKSNIIIFSFGLPTFELKFQVIPWIPWFQVISTPIDFLPPPEFVPQLLSADVSKRLKPRHLVYAETVQLAESPSERKKCLSSHSVCVNKVNQKTRRLRAKRDTDKEKEYQGSKGCLKHCCSGHFYQDSESGNFRCQWIWPVIAYNTKCYLYNLLITNFSTIW